MTADGDADALALGEGEADAEALALAAESLGLAPTDIAASTDGVARASPPQPAHAQAVMPASSTVPAAWARRRFVRVVTRQP
ncbi:hypothetical protein [Actinocrinis sp.]|uniref:hypothetical protein n=1 Tax=Actinocrinis sp. TaxID=1920516 RepID=UPI002D4511C0|nr:hypothetical protein [Actinocrinis sp.]HZP52356.1 hypothetical protein [Actinocrinis sp.]